MKQQTLPVEADSPRLSAPLALSSETDQTAETILDAASPASGTDQVEVLGAELSQRIQQHRKRERRAVW